MNLLGQEMGHGVGGMSWEFKVLQPRPRMEALGASRLCSDPAEVGCAECTWGGDVPLIVSRLGRTRHLWKTPALDDEGPWGNEAGHLRISHLGQES
jgi:hypothetical protein